jgi:hypothetical protein
VVLGAGLAVVAAPAPAAQAASPRTVDPGLPAVAFCSDVPVKVTIATETGRHVERQPARSHRADWRKCPATSSPRVPKVKITTPNGQRFHAPVPRRAGQVTVVRLAGRAEIVQSVSQKPVAAARDD